MTLKVKDQGQMSPTSKHFLGFTVGHILTKLHEFLTRSISDFVDRQASAAKNTCIQHSWNTGKLFE